MPRFPFQLRLLAAATVCLCAALVARAMSVVPPSFAELVAAADTVVRGIVTQVRTESFDSPQGRGIRTLVTLRVERALKGTPGETVTLSLLGGKVGRRTLRVIGMPEFRVGDRQIVFYAGNGDTLCPLIAAGHGRYHVRHDPASNRDFVARDNGVPLESTDEIPVPLEGAAVLARVKSPARALTPADFEARIATAVATPARPRLQP